MLEIEEQPVHSGCLTGGNDFCGARDTYRHAER